MSSFLSTLPAHSRPASAIISASFSWPCHQICLPHMVPFTPVKYASVDHTPCNLISRGTKCSQAVSLESYHSRNRAVLKGSECDCRKGRNRPLNPAPSRSNRYLYPQ